MLSHGVGAAPAPEDAGPGAHPPTQGTRRRRDDAAALEAALGARRSGARPLRLSPATGTAEAAEDDDYVFVDEADVSSPSSLATSGGAWGRPPRSAAAARASRGESLSADEGVLIEASTSPDTVVWLDDDGGGAVSDGRTAPPPPRSDVGVTAAHDDELRALRDELARATAGGGGADGGAAADGAEAAESQMRLLLERILALERAHGAELRQVRDELHRAGAKCAAPAVSGDARPAGEWADDPAILIALLRNQLAAAGLKPFDAVVSVEAAKARLRQALEKLENGECAAQADVDEWDGYLRAHPQYALECESAAAAWDAEQAPLHAAALRATRSFLPPAALRRAKLQTLLDAGVSESVAKRLLRTPALWLTRCGSAFISTIHHSDLVHTYSTHGLDLTELRAVWAVLPQRFQHDHRGEKANWKANVLQKLRDAVAKDADGTLTQSQRRHAAYAKAVPAFDAENVNHFDVDVDEAAEAGDAEAAEARGSRRASEAAP
ncbi:hypothetical protein M885DRAFT_613404 [Pelagophyceae sp. CCMP2097]|nr:hypothetical protein M885DRAFT_613404 [Pelagophyceae sp. CCMP2097]